MRDAHDDGVNDGPPPEDGTTDVQSSAVPGRRRKQALIGAVGLLAILGVGGIVAAQIIDDQDTAPTSQVGAIEPPAAGPLVPSAATSSTTGSPRASVASTDAAIGSASPRVTSAPADPEPTATTTPSRATAPTSTRTLRPLPPTANADAVSEADVTTSTVNRGGERLKIASARADLTGYEELGWIVGKGEKAGNARCTKKIKLSVDEAVREHPTLLICWRTSATKSVYTVAVKIKGAPSQKLSVAAVAKEWARLG
jgi:hypothetical protein